MNIDISDQRGQSEKLFAGDEKDNVVIEIIRSKSDHNDYNS